MGDPPMSEGEAHVNVDLCDHARSGEFPTPEELEAGLGSGMSTALKTCVILVLLINMALFMVLLNKFRQNIPQNQIPCTVWVTTLFTVTPFVMTLMVFLPQSTELLLACFRVYEAMVISRFVELNLMWWGGEKQLMNNLGDDKTTRYNLPPLCCCLWCIKDKLITRKRIKIFRFLAAQMIYVNAFVLFIQMVMYTSGERDHHPSLTNPHTYAKAFGKISFFFGFWALFVFFKIEHQYNLLDGSKYMGKFTLMKFFFVIFLLQETIVETTAIKGVIPCIPYISGKAKGFLILSAVVTGEALLFGFLQFYYYYKFPKTELKEKATLLKQIDAKAVE